ncbi:MAG: GNAT family N-acetyltransferase [Anaerotignum sp.]
MIRKFQHEDLETIMRLWLNTNIQAHDFVPKGYWIGNYVLVKSMLPKSELYVYDLDGKISGFIGIESGYIAGIFVSNEAQSKGIGKKLLNKAKEEYIELSMEVYKNNEKAVCFYERENFVIIKEHTDESTG